MRLRLPAFEGRLAVETIMEELVHAPHLNLIEPPAPRTSAAGHSRRIAEVARMDREAAALERGAFISKHRSKLRGVL